MFSPHTKFEVSYNYLRGRYERQRIPVM